MGHADVDLRPVIDAVRVSRDAHLRLTWVLLAGTPIAAAAGSIAGGEPAALGLGGAFFAFSIVSVLTALPHLRPERSRIVRVLLERPRDVVGVKVAHTHVDVAGLRDVKHDVIVELRGGDTMKLGVFGEALPGVVEAIRARAGLPS